MLKASVSQRPSARWHSCSAPVRYFLFLLQKHFSLAAVLREPIDCMNHIRNIIFDYDGTLVDTAPLIIATMQATIDLLQLPYKTVDECRATIGIRLEDVPDALWTGNDDVKRDFAATYRRVFEELQRPLSVQSFPGVLSVLGELHDHGYKMAIASSRGRKSLEEYVEQFGMSDYFEMIVGGNDVEHGKPAPDPVLKILDKCRWLAAETLTVGDAPVDILMGRAAGTYTCAVTYGNGGREELAAANATYIIDSFEDLKSILS